MAKKAATKKKAAASRKAPAEAPTEAVDLGVALIYLSDTETQPVRFTHDPANGTIVKPRAAIIHVKNRAYHHVGEDVDGRWTYRPV